MRPLSLITAAAVLAAAASGAQSSAAAQDRYSSRGVIYTPAAPSIYTAAAPQGPASQASMPEARAQVTRAAYSGRMLSWPGKVATPQPAPAAVAPQLPPPPQAQRQAPPTQVSYAAPQPARAAPPARDRYASVNTAPDTAPRPYANPLRREAPVRAAEPAPVMEQPIRRAAAPAPQPMPQAPVARRPMPQSIYDQPQAAPPPPAPPPVRQASVAPDPDFQGPYPPATKEPWRRLMGETAPAEARGVAVPLPDAQAAAPAAAQPKAPAKPAKAAQAPAKPTRTAEAPVAPQKLAAAPAGFRTPSSTSTSRYYSVHRQFGVEPDPIKMPQQFFLDGSPDLSEPPPPPVRRIAPTPGKSTATQRASQARSQETPDAAS